MRLITSAQARDQVHADGVDEAMLELYEGAAVDAAEAFLNRHLFADDSAMASAVATVPDELAAADTAYEAAIAAADELDGSTRCAMREAATATLQAAVTSAQETLAGMVANDAIRSAVLLILGHLYRNREDVQTGQGAAAVELPMGAHALLWPYRRGLGV